MVDCAMPTLDDPVTVYKELSDQYDRRGEPPMRDRFMVLAADAALRAGRTEESDRLRLRLLKLNPHHMLKPYASFTQALQAPDVQTYIRDLRLNYPPEVALVLLNSLRTTGMKLDDTLAPTAHTPAYDDDATVTLGETAEPLKVFADPRESDAPETAALPKNFLEAYARPTTQPQQGPTARSSSSVPRPPATAAPKKKPAPRPGLVAAPSPYHPPQEAEPPGGGWFAVALFVLVFVAALSLAGYIVARPFLP
jgi:hypothetical protein